MRPCQITIVITWTGAKGEERERGGRGEGRGGEVGGEAVSAETTW